MQHSNMIKPYPVVLKPNILLFWIVPVLQHINCTMEIECDISFDMSNVELFSATDDYFVTLQQNKVSK